MAWTFWYLDRCDKTILIDLLLTKVLFRKSGQMALDCIKGGAVCHVFVARCGEPVGSKKNRRQLKIRKSESTWGLGDSLWPHLLYQNMHPEDYGSDTGLTDWKALLYMRVIAKMSG